MNTLLPLAMNEKKKSLLTDTIPPALNGERVDKVLAELFPQYSRSTLAKWLQNGFITVDNLPLKNKNKVHDGQIIAVYVPNQIQLDNEPQDIALNILHEDESLIVLNKPAGMVVHPGAGHQDNTLMNALLYHCPTLKQLPRAGIIHRLDKDTTGLLVIAKTLETHHYLVNAMQLRHINRHYYALVVGEIKNTNSITTFLGRHPKNRIKMAVTKQGKKAITHYTIKENFNHFTLLDVQLDTGRTHQIRVHMKHIQHPIVGDLLYGENKKTTFENPCFKALTTFNRQALHAYQLTFIHPILQTPVTFNAPLPNDFAHLLDLLRDNNNE